MAPELASRLGVLALALAIEALAGYPDALYRAIGHPVTWIGALIGALDRRLNAEGRSFIQRRVLGAVALAVVFVAVVAPAALLQHMLGTWLLGQIVLAVAASTLLAAKSLDVHVRAVAVALDSGGLAAGRKAVAMIVGRDPDVLDEPGVCRAAIESLAENFSDGVVAPAFWFAVAGLPGIAAYKAINTADSMIGHRTPRHEAFGWAAARVDDFVNLPASRLSALLVAAAAWLIPGASPAEALRAVWRDAGTHRSPNAGWPEAAFAGALDLTLALPRLYHGVMSPGTPMGRGRENATAADIRRALALFRLSVAVGMAGVIGLAVLLGR